MAEIKVEGLRHVYSAGTPFEKVALDGIDLEIPQGQLIGIIGHTGSGKSTFIQHLNALLPPTEGKIYVGGKDINADKYARKAVKGEVGLVFQYPEYQLFEETVYKDIAFGPRNLKLAEEEIDTRVREAAGFVSVDEALFERSPLELSGGQKRRVELARAFAAPGELVLLDEPFGGLDAQAHARAFTFVRRHAGERVVVLATHDAGDAQALGAQVLEL